MVFLPDRRVGDILGRPAPGPLLVPLETHGVHGLGRPAPGRRAVRTLDGVAEVVVVGRGVEVSGVVPVAEPRQVSVVTVGEVRRVGFSEPLRLSAPPRHCGRGLPVVFVPTPVPRVPVARARSPPWSPGPKGRGPTVTGKKGLERPYLSLSVYLSVSHRSEWSLGLRSSFLVWTVPFSFVPGEEGTKWE